MLFQGKEKQHMPWQDRARSTAAAVRMTLKQTLQLVKSPKVILILVRVEDMMQISLGERGKLKTLRTSEDKLPSWEKKKKRRNLNPSVVLGRPVGNHHKYSVCQQEAENLGGSHQRCAEAAATAGDQWQECLLRLQLRPTLACPDQHELNVSTQMQLGAECGSKEMFH